MAIRETTELDANLAADTPVTGVWNLTTHFNDEAFTRSALPPIISQVSGFYTPDRLEIVELGAGTATFGRAISEVLAREGYTPRLLVSELQTELVVSIPNLPYIEILSPGDSLRLTEALAEYSQGSRLILSRAMTHYLSEKQHENLVREVANVIKPDELWIDQQSSGDEGQLRGFEAVLQGIAGKKMRYLTEDRYLKFIQNVQGPNGPLFEVTHLGYGANHRRGILELARRYLNYRFAQFNGLTCSNMGRELAEIVEIETTERELGRSVQLGELNQERAAKTLDDFIQSTKVYRRFCLAVATSLKTYLSEEDPTINIKYPIFSLKRTENEV